ncbi:MAG: glycosyltransferase family 39 protein [Blastocatellia bacterium]|nr:glycosyltransferase family 39 protein [Blastocatellia bacterium]
METPTLSPALPTRLRQSIPLWIDALVLMLVFLGLAAWSWRKWPDVFQDFGMELYLPWQLSQGKDLYADIAWKHGPLAQYINAGLFRLFGVSYSTLIAANLTLTGLVTILLHRLFNQFFDRLTAFSVSVVFLSVFAFSQYVRMGSFNFLSPYLHEQTHGVLLTLVMLWCWTRFCIRRQPGWLFGAGACLGLVALTKIELTLAAGTTTFCGLIGMVWFGPVETRRKFIAGACLVGGMAISIGLFLFFLSTRMPVGTALRGACGNFGNLAGNNVLHDEFYKYVTGLDAPLTHFWRTLWLTGGCVMVMGLLGWLCRRLGERQLSLPLVTVVSGGLALLGGLLPNGIPWPEIGLLLPVTTLCGGTWVLRQCLAQKDPLERIRRLPLLLWCVFALVMMTKMAFHVRLYHYGFTLAMPATLLLTGLCLNTWPRILEARWGGQPALRAAMVGLIAAGCLAHLTWANEFYSQKTLTVGATGDTMQAFPFELEPMGEVMRQTVTALNAVAPPKATVLVVPHGVTLNYLTRRANPTPFISLLGFDLKTYGGEMAVLTTVKNHPPDFIVLMHSGVKDFEYGYFGSSPGSGKALVEWIHSAYTPVKQLGAEPFTDERPGVVILRRATEGT